MTAPAPTQAPTEFFAGDSVAWTRTLPNYPASAPWFLRYAFTSAGFKQTIEATAAGDAFDVALTPAQSAEFKPGSYVWAAFVVDNETSPTQRVTLEQGKTEVLPNLPALVAPLDGRSHAQRTLEALEATILGKASRDQQGYSIAGRSLQRMSPGELLKWRNEYRSEVRKEQRQAAVDRGEGAGNKSVARFVNG